jgi:hypothetical protein
MALRQSTDDSIEAEDPGLAGGAIMISDMFNNALKARIAELCKELSALIRRELDFVAESVQSQRRGGHGDIRRGSSNPFCARGARPSELVACGSWRSLQPRDAE